MKQIIGVIIFVLTIVLVYYKISIGNAGLRLQKNWRRTANRTLHYLKWVRVRAVRPSSHMRKSHRTQLRSVQPSSLTMLTLFIVTVNVSFFFKKKERERFIPHTVYTMCTGINYKIVPVTSLNKYLQYGTSGTESYVYKYRCKQRQWKIMNKKTRYDFR